MKFPYNNQWRRKEKTPPPDKKTSPRTEITSCGKKITPWINFNPFYLLFLCFIISFVCFMPGCMKPAKEELRAYRVTDVEGRTWEMRNFFSNPSTLVVFVELWDPVSINQLKALEEVRREKGSYLKVMAIISDEKDQEKIREVKQSLGCTFPFFQNNSLFINNFNKTDEIPYIIQMDSNFVVQGEFIGFLGKEQLKKLWGVDKTTPENK